MSSPRAVRSGRAARIGDGGAADTRVTGDGVPAQRGGVVLVGLVRRDVGVTSIDRGKGIAGLGGCDRARPAARDGERVTPRAVRGGRAAGVGDGCTSPLPSRCCR